MRRFHQARPKRFAGFLFRLEPFGSDKTVTITGPTIFETYGMDLTVTIERMVAAYWLMNWNFAGTDINAIYIIGNCTDYLGVAIGEDRVPLVERWRPRALHIWVISRFERGSDFTYKFDCHRFTPSYQSAVACMQNHTPLSTGQQFGPLAQWRLLPQLLGLPTKHFSRP